MLEIMCGILLSSMEENVVQNAPTSEAQPASQRGAQPVAQISETPKQKSWLVIGLAILVLLLLGTTGFLAYQNYQLKQQVLQKQPTPLPEVTKQPVIPSPTPTIDSTSNWETYTNTTAGFNIKHPSGWRKVETENWTGFGPQEIGEDVLWGVSFYDKSEKTVSEIKDEVGKQFSDRKQTEEAIKVNNLDANKVITTTNEFEGWYSVTIIIESVNRHYAIGNGAQTDTALNEMLLKRTGKEYNLSFEDFYSSFSLSK